MTNQRAGLDELIKPKVEYCGGLIQLWAVRLSKQGYGKVDLLLSYSSDIFLYVLDYDNFLKDYEDEQRALNRKN